MRPQQSEGSTGAKFAADCANMAAEGRYKEFIERLSSQMELVYAKASDKGAHTGAQAAFQRHCWQGWGLHHAMRACTVPQLPGVAPMQRVPFAGSCFQ